MVLPSVKWGFIHLTHNSQIHFSVVPGPVHSSPWEYNSEHNGKKSLPLSDTHSRQGSQTRKEGMKKEGKRREEE